MKIIPGPLSETTNELQQHLDVIRKFPNPPKVVQIDIVDGEFAPFLTFEPSALRDIDTHDFQLDLHLMTLEPIDFLPDLRDVPNVRRVIGQVEKMSSIGEFVSVVRDEMGCEVGLALDLYTQLEETDEDLRSDILDFLDQVSVVQVMGNQAGEQGEPLHPTALETLKQVVAYKNRHGLSFDIAVDIGMNATTLQQVRDLGATEVVVGSYLQGDDAAMHWSELLQLAK